MWEEVCIKIGNSDEVFGFMYIEKGILGKFCWECDVYICKVCKYFSCFLCRWYGGYILGFGRSRSKVVDKWDDVGWIGNDYSFFFSSIITRNVRVVGEREDCRSR